MCVWRDWCCAVALYYMGLRKLHQQVVVDHADGGNSFGRGLVSCPCDGLAAPFNWDTHIR